MSKTQRDNIRPVFVLGCPRSGTTLIGEFIATAPSLLNTGELSAIYFAHTVAEREYMRVPSPYKQSYLDELRAHSAQFMRNICQHQNKSGFVESTPWNMRVLRDIIKEFPAAIFVVCIRHYAGVILSMRSSWERGYKWAGPTDTDRAKIWAEMNGYINELPMEQTIFFSYDAMCEDPAPTVAELEKQLVAHGVAGLFDRSVFAVSHASSSARPKVALKQADGKSEMHPISSFDKAAWREVDEDLVQEIVGLSIEEIKRVSGIQILPVHTVQDQTLMMTSNRHP